MPSPTLEIAKREFLEHVLSWRFVLALALSTLLLVTSVVALSATYQEDLDRYLVRQENADLTYGGVSTGGEVARYAGKPNLLGIFVGGPGDEARTTLAERFGGFSLATSAHPGSASPTNQRFSPLDLGFVGAVVLTFMAILFSFDAVSGEKERGTLKLVLANPVPKDAVLLGKYLGGLASILGALAVAVLAGLAALSLQGLMLSGEDWLRLGIVALLLVLLVSAFYLVGLLVSSLSRRSGTSLLALTLVWLLLVFGAGNVAAVVAKEAAPTMSTSEVQEAERSIHEESEAQVAALGDELSALFQKEQQGNLTDAERARQQDLRDEQKAIYQRAEERRQALHSGAIHRLDAQLRLAERIAAVSPADSFRSLATMLARSDHWSYRHLADAAMEYERQVERERREWLEANPPRPIQMGGGPVGFVTFTDATQFDTPTMTYEPPSVRAQMASEPAVRGVLVLLAYNLVAFVGAYLAFLRYDVR